MKQYTTSQASVGQNVILYQEGGGRWFSYPIQLILEIKV